MTARHVATASLLAFAGVAVAYLLFEEALPQGTRTSPPPGLRPNRVDAYYFHGTARCLTCRALEAYGEEALRGGLSDALEEGSLVWRPTNVDLPENRHLLQDFQLRFRSLVLVEVRDGQVGRWKNLEQIWQLASDREACVSYIEEETRRFMESL
ncbi:nitrophenyl compound nitroreductase subunit ArsF family protein [Candidatus Latescibacterota bacterium]